MKQIIAIAILVAIVTICMINPICKADIVNPAEKLIESIGFDYIWSSEQRVIRAEDDYICFMKKYNAIYIVEKNTKYLEIYTFETENEWKIMSINLLTYITTINYDIVINSDADGWYGTKIKNPDLNDICYMELCIMYEE